MGNRYSKEELIQIKSLVAEGLSSREIGVRFGRSEAAIRNVRYRLNLRRKIEDQIKSLKKLKKKMRFEIDELKRSKACLSDEVISLEKKRGELLTLNEELIEKKIEDKVIELKIEKPELFYISDEEQIAILVGHFIKKFIS